MPKVEPDDTPFLDRLIVSRKQGEPGYYGLHPKPSSLHPNLTRNVGSAHFVNKMCRERASALGLPEAGRRLLRSKPQPPQTHPRIYIPNHQTYTDSGIGLRVGDVDWGVGSRVRDAQIHTRIRPGTFNTKLCVLKYTR